MVKIKSSEITPEQLFVSRRKFLTGVGAAAAGATFLGACRAMPGSPAPSPVTPTAAPQAGAPQPPQAGELADELGDSATPYASATGFNNYYEFTTEKATVAALAKGLKTAPWSIAVGGLAARPKTYAIEDILGRFTQEERIYRMRCVEGWSMVIPWSGFPLARLLREVEPTSQARYVRFETLLDPQQMPGQREAYFSWPYAEGLRLDEAMQDLAIIATGLYGKTLPPQSGAPLRLVVPWKYGFKSVKSIVKIELVADQPTSFWMASAPQEYGFYANVNPDVPHPRWSQASERRVGETSRRKTLLFNGYADEVASLYSGMDLVKNY